MTKLKKTTRYLFVLISLLIWLSSSIYSQNNRLEESKNVLKFFRISCDSLHDINPTLFYTDSVLWIAWKSGGNSWDDYKIQVIAFIDDSLQYQKTLPPIQAYKIWLDSKVDVTVDSNGSPWILSCQRDSTHRMHPVITYLKKSEFISAEIPAITYYEHNLDEYGATFLDRAQPLSIALSGYDQLCILEIKDSIWTIVSRDTIYPFYGEGFGPTLRSIVDSKGYGWLLTSFDLSFTGNYWFPLLLYSWSDYNLHSNVCYEDYSGPALYLLGSDSLGNLYITYKFTNDEGQTSNIARLYYSDCCENIPKPVLKKEWELSFLPRSISANASPVAVSWKSGNTLFVKTWEDSVWFETVMINLSSWGLSTPGSTDLIVDDSGYVWLAFDAKIGSQKDVFLAKIQPSSAEDSSIVGIERLDSSGRELPKLYILHQNYPNPFNTNTTIRFDLPEPNDININIYDILGNKIWSLESRNVSYSAGSHSIIWNGTNKQGLPVSTGVYIIQLKSSRFTAMKKAILLK